MELKIVLRKLAEIENYATDKIILQLKQILLKDNINARRNVVDRNGNTDQSGRDELLQSKKEDTAHLDIE